MTWLLTIAGITGIIWFDDPPWIIASTLLVWVAILAPLWRRR